MRSSEFKKQITDRLFTEGEYSLGAIKGLHTRGVARRVYDHTFVLERVGVEENELTDYVVTITERRR